MKPLIFIIASLLSFPVAAQTSNCASRDAVIQKLSNVGEIQIGIGLDNKGSLMEIWTSEATGTWTVVMTFTNGMSCVMTYGESWTEPVQASLKVEGRPV